MVKKYIHGLIFCLVLSGITGVSYGESGTSGGGSGLISVPTVAAGAPTTSTFITQTPDAGLSAEQALNALGDGLLKHASGVVAQAVSGTDYITPTGTETLTNKTITDLSNMVHADVVHLAVRNVSGSTIDKGQPVYVSGYNVGQDKVEISLADADVAGSMPAIGLVEADILNNANGQVLVSGVAIPGIVDTSSFSVGDVLYVSTTVGTLTATRPSTNGDLVQAIAKVNRSHATLGVVLVQGAGRTNDIPNNLTMINTGAFRTGTTAADTAILAAYDVNGVFYTTFATLTANNEPSFTIDEITSINRTSADLTLQTTTSGDIIIAPSTGIIIITGTLDTSGGIYTNIVAKTSAYTTVVSDYTITCGAGNETFTVTLIAAANVTGQILYIKNIGTGTVTVDGNAAETIDGATTLALSTQYASITIQSDGSNWHIF